LTRRASSPAGLLLEVSAIVTFFYFIASSPTSLILAHSKLGFEIE
jgi:hypothetical protein